MRNQIGYNVLQGRAYMKPGIRIMLAVFLFSLAASVSYGQKGESGAQNITSVINTARYILFGGTYTLFGGSVGGGQIAGDKGENAVFKLDTYTGKTWVLKVEKSVNGRVACWVPVDESATVSADNKEDQKRDNGQRSTSKALKTLDE